MLRDASQRQASQKFSFISSLNLSRAGQTHARSPLDPLNTDRSCGQQHPSEAGKLATQAETAQSTTVIATTSTSETTTIDSNWYGSTTDYSLSLAEIVNASTDRYLEPKTDNSTINLSKIIFALACSYGLFVSFWLFGHQSSKVITLLTGGKQIALSKSEVDFIDYLEKSLAQIDRQLAAKKDEGEVVYVPVYTPNPSNSIPLTALPNPTPAISQPVAPSEPLAIPAPPPLPSPIPLDESVEQAIATKPQINHTLIGVLELGAGSSAALVKVDGQTRRIWLGEKIHTDGWILESVGNQQATISRQGEVRSISVGETF